MKTFITSDLHFGHKNIIKFGRKQFESIDEMDARLIENWNNTVGEHDTVYCLGDMFLCGTQRAVSIASQLNGRKILILGNHDNFSKAKYQRLGFSVAGKFAIVNDYLLSHEPVAQTVVENAVALGLIKGNLHGHLHHSLSEHRDAEYMFTKNNRHYLDVGIDGEKYKLKPVRFDSIDLKASDIDNIISALSSFFYEVEGTAYRKSICETEMKVLDFSRGIHL